ncbi:MAG: cation:proton antiporter [bacterium]|nr:cation:proton antiporter [bacterium]
MKKVRKYLLTFAVISTLILSPAVVDASPEPAVYDNGSAVEIDSVTAGEHEAGTEGAGHVDPVASVLLWIIVILLAAKIGGEIFEKFNQPAVLGELIFGVLVGNLHLIGITWFIPIASDIHIDILSRIGVIILLFMVGLESNIKEMMKVGVPSLLVATVGVIAPFVLGFFVSKFFFPEAALNVHLFIGATLTATSVGITARVFKDLGKLQLPEAKIILGAAVIDDIMGLIVLAVVSGIITTGAVSLISVGAITLKSVVFLIGSIVIGTYTAPWVGKKLARMQVEGMKVISALIFAFILAWAANAIGLATIVGAFAAGLILDDVHFKLFTRKDHHGKIIPEFHIENLIQPIAAFLVPIFFVLMGIQVKLETFTDVKVLGVAAGLTIAAVIGKQVCGLVVNKGYSRLVIGLGMIPRGEVGLIFAAIGKSLGVVNDATFSAIVIMVIVTTLVTPPLLKIGLDKMEKKQKIATA